MIFLGINFHQSIKLFRGGEAQLVRSKEASCQRLCVRLSSQCARECLSCMKSIVQILPSCFTHPMSQIKTLGAKKEEARTGTIMEQMSPFRSVFPCRCIKMPQSKAEPHQTAALLLNIQSEQRHFLTTSHRFQESTDIMLNVSYSKLHRFAFEKKKNSTQINTEQGRYISG